MRPCLQVTLKKPGSKKKKRSAKYKCHKKNTKG